MVLAARGRGPTLAERGRAWLLLAPLPNLASSASFASCERAALHGRAQPTWLSALWITNRVSVESVEMRHPRSSLDDPGDQEMRAWFYKKSNVGYLGTFKGTCYVGQQGENIVRGIPSVDGVGTTEADMIANS